MPITMIERCCAFTGHHPRKFPCDCNEVDARYVAPKKVLVGDTAKLVDAGYTAFFSGMAEGVDDVVYANWEYHDSCMLERNRYLVDYAACLLAVLQRQVAGRDSDGGDTEP